MKAAEDNIEFLDETEPLSNICSNKNLIFIEDDPIPEVTEDDKTGFEEEANQ